MFAIDISSEPLRSPICEVGPTKGIAITIREREAPLPPFIALADRPNANFSWDIMYEILRPRISSHIAITSWRGLWWRRDHALRDLRSSICDGWCHHCHVSLRNAPLGPLKIPNMHAMCPLYYHIIFVMPHHDDVNRHVIYKDQWYSSTWTLRRERKRLTHPCFYVDFLC